MHFGDFAGNAQAKKLLAADIDAGRFPHALLIEGEAGSGRRTLARILARAAVCRSSAERPCGMCDACRKSEHPDITLYGDEGSILSVDTIRSLRQEAYVLPNESAYRVMLLAGAQSMTPQAQNALLKILEEPPRHVLFILTCENRTQLLETIRSRCVCVTLGAVDWDEAMHRLNQYKEEEHACRLTQQGKAE
jgi:DNA polymerase-3 subunit delta'